MFARSHLRAALAVAGLSACATFPRNALHSAPDLEPAALVQVDNRTTEAFRMSLVADRTVRALGTVPALETREFTLPAWILRTYDEIQLVATVRDRSGDERVSLKFHAEWGKTARWVLDGTRLPVVVVR